MTDEANIFGGARRNVRHSSLDGGDQLRLSVALLVSDAPAAPPFPPTTRLASLDPEEPVLPKQWRRKWIWLGLLALISGGGIVVPRFAGETPNPAAMMIVKRLPRGLSLVAVTERMGGTPYLERSSFDWTDGKGDSVSLSVALDRAASEQVFKTARVAMPSSQFSEVPFPKNVSLANGIRATLTKAPETNPQFEWLSWSVPGFDLTLSRIQPKKNGLALVTIADQISSTEVNKWMVDPKVPDGYREVTRLVATGKIEKTSSEFQAQIADSDNERYTIFASEDPQLRFGNPADKVIEIAGKQVKPSKNYVSFVDGGLRFNVLRERVQILPIDPLQKPLSADPTVRALVAAAGAGNLQEWKKQMSRPRTGYEVKETTTYKGLKMRYAAPTAKFGDELVCVDQVTLGSCRPISMRADPNALSLPGGSWLVIGMLRSLTSARGEYDYNAVKTLPATTPEGASFNFDVLPIGIGDRIGVGVLPNSVSYLNLESGRGRINRPRGY